MHEISHALGPRTVKTGPNKGKSINEVIGSNYWPLEEAKADVTGIHSLNYLMAKNIIDPQLKKTFYMSYFGTLFRSMRFGLNQAHAKAAIISLNYYAENGGVSYDGTTGRWVLNFETFENNVTNLAEKLLLLESNGDNAEIQLFFDQWAVITPRIQQSIKLLEHLPIDVMPTYSIDW
jgi:hypothetical protein